MMVKNNVIFTSNLYSYGGKPQIVIQPRFYFGISYNEAFKTLYQELNMLSDIESEWNGFTSVILKDKSLVNPL